MGKIDGFKAALEALRGLDERAQQRILSDILAKDPEMANRLKANLVLFEDLLRANPQGLARLFQEVPDVRWVLALRGKTAEFVAALLKDLANRRSDLLKAAIAQLGPQPVTKIENAQREIVKKALELESQGLLVFAKSNDSVV